MAWMQLLKQVQFLMPNADYHVTFMCLVVQTMNSYLDESESHKVVCEMFVRLRVEGTDRYSSKFLQQNTSQTGT